jgi:hypothetical protein
VRRAAGGIWLGLTLAPSAGEAVSQASTSAAEATTCPARLGAGRPAYGPAPGAQPAALLVADGLTAGAVEKVRRRESVR